MNSHPSDDQDSPSDDPLVESQLSTLSLHCRFIYAVSKLPWSQLVSTFGPSTASRLQNGPLHLITLAQLFRYAQLCGFTVHFEFRSPSSPSPSPSPKSKSFVPPSHDLALALEEFDRENPKVAAEYKAGMEKLLASLLAKSDPSPSPESK